MSYDRTIEDLKSLFGDLTGEDLRQADPNADLLDLGFDSLVLTQASAALKKRFNVKISFRELLESYTTLEDLAKHLCEQMPGSLPLPPPPVPHTAPEVVATGTLDRFGAQPPPEDPDIHSELHELRPDPEENDGSASVLERVMKAQLKVMEQQLALLRGNHPQPQLTPTAGAVKQGLAAHQKEEKRSLPSVASSAEPPAPVQHGPFRQLDKGAKGGLTEQQQRHLEWLTRRYVARTIKSKEYTQLHRRHFADPRAVAGFKLQWKEMVYPIVSSRSAGAYLWDLDGNRWVDVTLGFGVGLLGHSPPFITETLKRQLDVGVEIGPQSPLAGEVAQLITEFTGMERVAFCNTGSEAVMAAIRVCRTVTGRSRIVFFAGDYHGTFDEVLAKGAWTGDQPKTMPLAPGVLPNLISEVTVLEYGSERSLEWIRQNAEDLAAVLVEPVQSRNPGLQPREFLRELRWITEAAETPLIFDEVITGFRCHPGGAQAYFGVRADLATYGKIIGGGMPIGFIAGRKEYMDALDGGFWSFGDDSFPPSGVTFFAGTFVRHPLAMAAAKAMLLHLKEEGPQLQTGLAERTRRLLGELNDHFLEHRVPLQLDHFTSVWYPHFGAEVKYGSLLYYHLREKGLHIWEGRPCFLSTAHTADDEAFIQQAFKSSVAEMQKGGFLPEADGDGSLRRRPAGETAEHVSSGETLPCSADASDSLRFPLSEAQREMWIGSQMRPEAAGPHHACTGLYLDGDLDIEALRRAIRAVVQRHEGLRCTFSADGSKAVPHPDFLPEVPVHDLSHLPELQRESRVNAILHQEARRLMDLEKGPLVDFQILRLTARLHLLVFTVQMIVCDGWAHYVVFEDLGAIYSALADGTEPSVKPAVPMRDFSHWERANSTSDEARECEKFWLSQFQSVPAPINLPTLRPRLPARTFEGDRCEITLPPDLCRSIRRIAKEQKNSYFAFLLAAFQVWLHRLSGACDLVVVVPFAAQSPLGMDRLVGQCANILPLRTCLQPEEAFSSVLKNSWSAVLGAQENWNFSFGRLISQLELPYDPSRIPLASVLFNLDPPMAKVKFKNLAHRFISGPRCYFQYDLGFNLVEDDDIIRVECDYNRNMFDKEVVGNWAAGYQAILEAVVKEPDGVVSRLPMVTEQQGFGLTGNDSLTADAGGASADVYSLIAEQANRRPQAVAVSANGTSLTYGEIGDRSNRLASRLRSMGVGPDVVVGICAGPSPHVLVGLLAIFRAGGAYALIDSDLTVEELDHVLKDTGMLVILVDGHSAARFATATLRVVRLDENDAGDTPDTLTSPATFANAEHLACIVYQRGPNGGLEGVEITHGALANFLLAMRCELQLGDQDVFLYHSRLTGHGEAFELLLPLWLGARVVIASGASVLEPKALNNIIREDGITVMQATPSAWRLLLDAGWPGSRQFKALCRGEALHWDLADRLAERCAAAYTVFGTAETTFAAMVGRIRVGKPPVFERAVDNSRVVIVDPSLEPVPVGVSGEILVAGGCLARGYRNGTSLAGGNFLHRAIGGQNPCRLFRTADMARFLPNGQIEYIGRKDQRVLIPGGMVELGDIERVLRKHPAVSDVAVCFRDDPGEQPGLVAYISTGRPDLGNDSNPLTPEMIARELGRLVRNALPGYMRPQRAVVLKTFPRGVDGRIDRTLLPAPTKDDPGLADHVDPTNEVEETLAGIWQELLDIPKVSIKESFFDLGGKSLLAVRLFVRIEKEFGRKLPLATLFQAPTIEKLARALMTDMDKPSKWPSLVPIQTQGTKPPLFLVHGAGGNVLLYRALAKRLAPEYPLYGLQSQGLDGQSEPLRTIEEMAEYYLDEIREIQRRGPYLLGGYCLGGTIAYEMAQQLRAIGEEVALVAMLDTYNFSRALKASFYSFLLQKFRFHWGNFISLGFRKMWRYLREKKRIASDGGWAHIRTEMPGSTLPDGVARAEFGAEASVQEINDHAADIYVPKPYPGIITLFKPHINYKFYPDPKMGWGDLALQGLDIVEMPINPHAMLVEPYVEDLAKLLKARLGKWSRSRRQRVRLDE